MTGAAVDATRRFATRTPSRTRVTVGAVSPASGRVTSHTTGPTITGASRVSPRTSAIAENIAVVTAASAVAAADVHTIATPRAVEATPKIQRAGVMVRFSTADSRSASSGATLPARRDADHTPPSATTSPTPADASSVHTGTSTDRPGGIRRARCSSVVNGSMTATPSPTPAADATVPTRNASAKSVRLTWRGVAPIVRISPNSRWRCATPSANVDATTKIETKADRPAMTDRNVPASARI